MIEQLDGLPPQVKPAIVGGDGGRQAILIGDSWAPSMCAFYDKVENSVDVMIYAVAKNWPSNPCDTYNLYLAMLRAPSRGVVCRMSVAGHKPGSSAGAFNQRAAVTFAESGWQVRWHKRAKLLHAKAHIFDRTLTVLGSHNLSLSASESNVDISLAVSSVNLARAMQEVFDAVWRDSTVTMPGMRR